MKLILILWLSLLPYEFGMSYGPSANDDDCDDACSINVVKVEASWVLLRF